MEGILSKYFLKKNYNMWEATKRDEAGELCDQPNSHLITDINL